VEIKLSLIEAKVEKSYANLQGLALNGPTFTSIVPTTEKTERIIERSSNGY
jgi:hypothetical protein